MAVSGTGVALATAGGVLLYAGLKGESPLTALREIITTGPSGLSASSLFPDKNVGTAIAGATGSLADATGSVVDAFGQALAEIASLAGAAQRFKDDKYSQVRRWQNGYSDCSSFVGKSLKSLGINPPGASVTGDYLVWPLLYKVKPSQAQSGDLLVNSNHMAIVTGPNQAIGQQNPRSNVRTGTFADIMFGTGPYVVLRFVNLQTDKLTNAQILAVKKAIPNFTTYVPGHTTTSTTGFTY